MYVYICINIYIYIYIYIYIIRNILELTYDLKRLTVASI